MEVSLSLLLLALLDERSVYKDSMAREKKNVVVTVSEVGNYNCVATKENQPPHHPYRG